MKSPESPEIVRGKRILLVEDDDANRQLMEDYLNHYGHVVTSIANGSRFFETIAEFCPEIILLDLKLPDISGYTLLEQLGQHQTFSRIPVIVISAFAFRVDQQRAIDLGARRYFVKPLNLSGLRQAIQGENLSPDTM